MLRYQLAVYVHAEVHNRVAAQRCVDAIAQLDPQPSRILVVDHAHGRQGYPRNAVMNLDSASPEDRQAYRQLGSGHPHGLHPPAFEPRAALHQLADEVRCGHDWHWRDTDPDRPARWRRALRFKRYAIETAIEHEMDAVMFLRFPDIIHPQGPKAMLRLFEQNQQVAWSWLPILAGNDQGTPTSLHRRMPGRVDRLDPAGKITEEGFMLRLAGFDVPALDPLGEPGTSNVPNNAEPILIMHELLRHGHGQGVRRLEGNPVHYIAVEPPHLDASLGRTFPTAVHDRIVQQMREEVAVAIAK